jgi:hypothetical protein
VVIGGDATWRIRGSIVVAVALQLIAFVLLFPGVDTRPWVAGLAVLCLLAAASLWQLAMGRARAEDSHGKTRWLIPLLLLTAGLVVYIASVVWVSPLGALGLTGVCAFLIGAGQLLAEARQAASPKLGGWLCVGCAVAFFAGLGAFLIEPRAPWLACIGLGLALSTLAFVLKHVPGLRSVVA